MNVLKFGGTSMGSPLSIINVVRIISDKIKSDKLLVTVSAMSGTTDQLIQIADLAQRNNSAYKEIINQIEKRHRDTIIELIDTDQAREAVFETNKIFEELKQLVNGVFLLKELPGLSNNKIISTGEYLSAIILHYKLLELGVKVLRIDSKEFIKGNTNGRLNRIDYDSTYRNISRLKETDVDVIIAPGFVASDENGKTITLGRGGSDFSASLYAAGLDSVKLEIWTDVNGVYTADPKMVTGAVPISKMSFNEAMELSHFGAKVIYAPTLHPLLQKKINIVVKNTFNPEGPGTLITHEPFEMVKQIQGLSSIGKICLVSLAGPGMTGITGVSARFFAALARENLNVIMITQASSEHSICIALREEDGKVALQVLENEFVYEISIGTVNTLSIENGFSIISLVGENMINTRGICGKAFSAIGKNGINIHAIAQGSSEISVSFVIKENFCKKALNVLHEEFFLSSSKTINLYIAGVGNVGSKLMEIIRMQQKYLEEKLGIRLIVKGLCNSKKMIFNESGINLNEWKENLFFGENYSIESFILRIKDQNLRNSIFVDNTASNEVSENYENMLQSYVGIVTCNKIATSSGFKQYKKLKETARRKNIRFLFESNVGAGLPIINTINNMLASGDEILSIEGVLSGSINFILNELFAGSTFKESLLKAMKEGYTEPDPRIDLSGKDVARKLLILAREAGYPLEMEDIVIQRILPEEFFQHQTVNEFLLQLDLFENEMNELCKHAMLQNRRLRFVARFDKLSASASLQEVSAESPFYQIDGKDNLLIIRTKWYNNQPLIIKGAGAGAELTASGIMADIIQAGS